MGSDLSLTQRGAWLLCPPLFPCPSPSATRTAITIKSPPSLDSLGPPECSPRPWTCWSFPVSPDVPMSLAEILDVNKGPAFPVPWAVQGWFKEWKPHSEYPEVTFGSHSGWRDCWLEAWALWQQEPQKHRGDIHIQLPSEITDLTERLYKKEFIRHTTLFFFIYNLLMGLLSNRDHQHVR